MRLRRALLLIMLPLLAVVCIITTSWMVNKKVWYFRGYEYYSDWVYTGLAEPNVVMWESGDSARDFLIDHSKSQNSISLNEFGHRIEPCTHPTVLGLGDSQLFGSGLDDRQTFPFQVLRSGGPCIYNAGRHNTIESLQISELNVRTVLVTSTERDGFRWYCNTPPESWSFQKSDKSELTLERVTAPRLALSTAVRRTVSVMRSKIQNLIALRIFAPDSRIIKFQHRTEAGEIEEDISCAIRVNDVLQGKGFETAFLLFPAAQTLNPDYAQQDLDDQTLNYISNLTSEMTSMGLTTIDSKKCLEGNGNAYVQLHDTHLSALGMQKLAQCVVNSKILELIREE